MKKVTLIFLLSITINQMSFGQSLKLENETNYKFDSIIVFYERIEGRHLYEYRPQGAFGRPDYKYSSTTIKSDTLRFKKKIKFKNHGVYTIKFIVNKDSSLYVFGLNTNKKSKFILSETTCVWGLKKDHAYEDTAEIQTSYHYIDLYFNFINSSDYAIYSIYPHLSDEKIQRGSILANEPDRKLIPKEERKILVAANRTMDSYNSNMSINFKIFAVDKDGNLVEALVKNIPLSSDDVGITNSNIIYKK